MDLPHSEFPRHHHPVMDQFFIDRPDAARPARNYTIVDTDVAAIVAFAARPFIGEREYRIF